MVTPISKHKQSELKRILKSAAAAKDVYRHALGEAFLRFERNIDSDLAREVVDVLKSREQAALWMATPSVSNNLLTAYEVYLEKGRAAFLELLERKKAENK